METPFIIQASQLQAAAGPVYSAGLVVPSGDTNSFGFLATLEETGTAPYTLAVEFPMTSADCSLTTFAASATTALSTSNFFELDDNGDVVEAEQIETFTIAYYTGSVLCPIANSLVGEGPATILAKSYSEADEDTYTLYCE
jgi:hypothetical protein